jgi:hypothetical protein
MLATAGHTARRERSTGNARMPSLGAMGEHRSEVLAAPPRVWSVCMVMGFVWPCELGKISSVDESKLGRYVGSSAGANGSCAGSSLPRAKFSHARVRVPVSGAPACPRGRAQHATSMG